MEVGWEGLHLLIIKADFVTNCSIASSHMERNKQLANQ